MTNKWNFCTFLLIHQQNLCKHIDPYEWQDRMQKGRESRNDIDK